MKTIEEMKSFPAARKNYRPEKVEKLSEEQMKWFRDAKFGMFIHWGVSVSYTHLTLPTIA